MSAEDNRDDDTVDDDDLLGRSEISAPTPTGRPARDMIAMHEDNVEVMKVGDRGAGEATATLRDLKKTREERWEASNERMNTTTTAEKKSISSFEVKRVA